MQFYFNDFSSKNRTQNHSDVNCILQNVQTVAYSTECDSFADTKYRIPRAYLLSLDGCLC